MRVNIYFKTIILLLAFVQHPFTGTAQNYPADQNSSLPGTATAIALPPANTTPSAYNFIRNFVPRVPMSNAAALTLNGSYDYHVVTAYLNGWGESLQTNVRGNIAGNTDIITPHDLRPSLRKASFLPYNAAVRSKFRTNRFVDQRNFYNSLYPAESGISYALDTTWFSNGVVTTKSYQPGKVYAGQKRGAELRQFFGGNGVANLTVNETTGAIIYNGSYPANSLVIKEYKSISHNNGVKDRYNWAYETYDKDGRLVCKQVISDSTNGISQTTYYVYDDMSRLRYLLPPNRVEELQQNGWNFNTQSPNKPYSYEYNQYGKVIASSKPGQDGYEYVVYDSKQRPVMYQSPLLASRNEWQFTVYDSRDRVIMTGLLKNTLQNSQGQPYSRADWQYYMDHPPTIPPPSLDVYTLLAHGFNGQFPTNLANVDVHQYNYYDSYTHYQSTANPQANQPYKAYYTGLASDFITGVAYAVTPQPYNYVVGSLTASKTKVLDPYNQGGYTSDWIENVYYYDQKGRLIQTLTRNPFNNSNWDVTAQQYSFSGDPICSVALHYADAVTGNSNKPQTKIEVRRQLHQNGPQVGWVKMSIDDGDFVELSSYQYDDLKRVIQKNLGGVNVQNYTYDIRGNLTGINTPYVRSPTLGTNMTFAESLHRELGFNDRHYDGRLSGFQWRGTSGPAQSYGYSYDGAGRLTSAMYMQIGSGSSWQNTSHNYTLEHVGYDGDGNIKKLKQYGPDASNLPALIDNLTYSYANGRLDKVVDSGANAPSIPDFINGASGSGTDYSYDLNGNLTADANKGITSISYNHQNKPQYLNIGASSINNVYDAAGNLLYKMVYDNNLGTQNEYRYWGPFTYKLNSTSGQWELQYLLHSEGRCRWIADSSLFKYDYFVKDHIGNVRQVITADEYKGYQEYLATHELLAANVEGMLFGNIDDVRSGKPEGIPSDMEAAELHGAEYNKRIGTSLAIKVMAGDKISLETWGYYNDEEGDMNSHATAEDMLASILSSLNAGTTLPNGAETGGTDIVNDLFSENNYLTIYDQIKEDKTNPAMPRAYLNYLFFDQDMKLVAPQSGTIQLTGEPNEWLSLGLDTVQEVKQNGYFVAYLSNEQYMPVYFDNLHIVHYKGRLLEEQHYYPHGMLMGKVVAANADPENKFQYQGKLMQDELGEELYDFHARQYDPQIGRFWGTDPLNEFASGYVGMGNDPANLTDPTGMQSQPAPTGPKPNGASGGANWGDYGYLDEIINRMSYYLNRQDRTGEGQPGSINTNSSLGAADPCKDPNAVGGGITLPDINVINNKPDYVGWGKEIDRIFGQRLGWDFREYGTDYTSSQDVTPFQVGWEWLSGTGPRSRNFVNGDYFTGLLQKHSHVTQTKSNILNKIAGGATVGASGVNPYKLNGIQGVGKYVKDYSTLATAGATGNLAVTYLGSYNLNWSITAISDDFATVQFSVYNASTMQSASRPPVIGYWSVWQNTVGKTINNYFSTGWGSKTTQSFIWTETLNLR